MARPPLPHLAATLAALGSAALNGADAPPEIAVHEPLFALVHARVVDATNPSAREDQTIVVRDGRIAAVGADKEVAVPTGARTIDLTGKTVVPGLVLAHEHLYYAL